MFWKGKEIERERKTQNPHQPIWPNPFSHAGPARSVLSLFPVAQSAQPAPTVSLSRSAFPSRFGPVCALLSIRPAPHCATPPPCVARSTVQPSASPSPPRCSPVPHASSTRSRARRRSTMLTDSHGPPVIPHLRLPRANYQPDPRRDHRAASALDPHAEAGPSLLNAPWPSPAPYASHPATSNPNAAALELQARSCPGAAVDRPLCSASATTSCCKSTAAGS